MNDLIKKKISNYSDDIEIINSKGIIDKIDTTIKAIENRKSVIINAILCNTENNTYGYSNIIIKSNLLLEIFPFLNGIDYNFCEGCEFSNNWHYILLDCTLCTLIIKEMNYQILNNSKNYLLLKSKLFILNEALSKIQNFKPKISIILAKRYISKNKNEYTNVFDKIGIQYTDSKIIGEKITNGINWLKKLDNEGNTWDINNIDLYPNMCNKLPNEWNNEKYNIALKNNEISLLWGCGPKERNNALKCNINSWKDIKCNADILGLTGKKKKIVDSIININKYKNDIIISPSKIKNYNNINLIKSDVLEFM